MSGVSTSNPAKRQRRPQRDAWCRILAAHDGVHIIANHVQTGDGLALRIEGLGAFIAADTAGRADVAGIHLDGIKRTLLQFAQTGVGLLLRVSKVTVVRGTAFAKIVVLAALGKTVESDR